MSNATTADAGAGWPAPRAPNSPVASFGLCIGAPAPRLAAVHDAGESLLLGSGRAAIAMALRAGGVGAADAVLLPAYHCMSMVEPVRASGATPVYYRLRPNLSADLDDLAKKIDDSTRAVVVVHYFGFPARLDEIRALCDQHGLLLIEDCAHACFGEFDGRAPGTVGDYAIASLTKFFPVPDGGCLASAKHSLGELEIRPASGATSLKRFINLVERSMGYGRLRPMNWIVIPLIRVKDAIWTRIKQSTASRRTDAAPRSRSERRGYGFDPQTANVAMTGVSRMIVGRASVNRLIARRRRHYGALLAALSDVPGCRPAFAELPAGVVPYAFGLIIDDHGRVFPELKRRGVPIFRWEDLDSDECDVSMNYSLSLLQFPCHQELRDDEVSWIGTTVRRALSTA